MTPDNRVRYVTSDFSRQWRHRDAVARDHMILATITLSLSRILTPISPNSTVDLYHEWADTDPSAIIDSIYNHWPPTFNDLDGLSRVNHPPRASLISPMNLIKVQYSLQWPWPVVQRQQHTARQTYRLTFTLRLWRPVQNQQPGTRRSHDFQWPWSMLSTTFNNLDELSKINLHPYSCLRDAVARLGCCRRSGRWRSARRWVCGSWYLVDRTQTVAERTSRWCRSHVESSVTPKCCRYARESRSTNLSNQQLAEVG